MNKIINLHPKLLQKDKKRLVRIGGMVDDLFDELIEDGNTVAVFDETGMTKSELNEVSKIVDSIGGVNYLSREEDATKQPIYQASTNSILFNGVAHWMQSQAWTWNQPTFLYLIVRMPTWSSNEAIFDGRTAFSTYMIQRTSSPNVAAGAGNDEVNNPNLSVGEWGIIRVKFHGGSSTTQINETLRQIGSWGTRNPAGFTLGAFGNGSNKSNIDVMFPIILRKGDETDANQQIVYEALKEKIDTVLTWQNLKSNRSRLKSFITKNNSRTVDSNNQLNLVMVGDSIFGRMNGTEISDNGKATAHFPPGAWQKNIQQKILDAYQFGTVSYYNVKAAEVTLSGTWALQSNADNNEFYTNSVTGSYAEITVTGCTFFKVLFKDVTGGNTYGRINVTINGSLPSELGITGVDYFYGSNVNGEYLKWDNKIWKGLNAGTSYTFRFTKATDELTILWGFEKWTAPRLNVINAGVGGHTAVNHNAEHQKFLSATYNADLILHELPLLNDSNDAGKCKGSKIPSSAAISAVAGDFIFAITTGTFTNYSGLVLAVGEYAEYDGANWIKGSSVVDAMLSTYTTNLAYLDVVAASGRQMLCFTTHQTTIEPNRPWMQSMLTILRNKMTTLGLPFVDLNKKYTDKSLTVATYVADGVHLNDAGVQLYINTFKEVF